MVDEGASLEESVDLDPEEVARLSPPERDMVRKLHTKKQIDFYTHYLCNFLLSGSSGGGGGGGLSSLVLACRQTP